MIITVLIMLCTSCTSQHSSWMDNAYVGYVDNQAVVLFDAGKRNGIQYYRPQFQSECHFNKAYIDEQSSTGGVINENRIRYLRPFLHQTHRVMVDADKMIRD